MPDSLANAVRKFDMSRNTERSYAVTQRSVAARHVCMLCRKSSSATKRKDEQYLPINKPCPTCGGKIIQVVW